MAIGLDIKKIGEDFFKGLRLGLGGAPKVHPLLGGKKERKRRKGGKP